MLLSDAEFMEKAIAQAQKCGQDVPVGCVIASGGQVVAAGFNQREELADPTGHAELIAIRRAAAELGRWRLDGLTLYVTLEPCPMCAEAILQCRVSRLVFGAYDPVAGAAGSAFNLFLPDRRLPLPEIIGGILEDRCRGMLTDFFQALRSPDKQCS